MRINTKCSQAVHILLMLAMLPAEEKITSAFLAGSVGSNPVEIRRLLSSLGKAGLIQVARGPGGASLAREPADITLLDIYRAVDPKSLDELIGVHGHPTPECLFGGNITALLAEPYAEIGQAVQRQMEGITLAQLCRRLGEMEPGLAVAEKEG